MLAGETWVAFAVRPVGAGESYAQLLTERLAALGLGDAEGEDPTVVDEIGMTVVQVFLGAGLPSLGSKKAIQTALGKLRNILAELGALHLLLRVVPENATLTVVHDYEGVAAWMEGRWRTKDAIVAEVVESCRSLVCERRLTVSFHHQRGHQSS